MERARRWIEELKRRRMFRAVAAYAVAVFAILQIAETVVHGLHLPDWTVTAVVVATAAGFPIVLAAAWYFDVTTSGVVRTAPASATGIAPAAGLPEDDGVAPGAMTALLEQLAQAPERAAPDPPRLRAGDLVGRFELLREIGRGGFGVVFEARDRDLGRLVALKTVRPRRGVDAAALRAEAEAAAQLQHPNIVTVHDVGATGAEAWIVLELLRGETLEDRLRRGALPMAEALRIAIDVARGLAHAHRAGVVHRDLKPANIFLCEDGAAKILDFGLSRVFGSGGAEGGTPAYMAPEQWRRERQDARTDVFAAAVILFEMVSGARPYSVTGGRSSALDARHAPALEAARAPRGLRRLVACAADPSPERRPADGAAWLESLLDVDRRQARRRTARTGIAVGGAALAAGAVALAVVSLRPRIGADADGSPRIPVAVADFQNGTADPELNGLSGMLVTSLEQSRRLVVLTRSRLVDAIRQLGKEPPAMLDESLAREIGRSVGVRALLLATVHRFDDRYAIELRALDPVENAYLFTLKEEGRGKASIPDMIDRLASATRERLRDGERDAAGSNGRRVAEITTGNLAAYEHYFRARQAIDLRQFGKARGELQAALQIDPEFALAHLGVVVLDSWTHKSPAPGSDAEVRAHLETAVRLVDRLPEKERLALLAWKASVDGRVDDAVHLRDEAARAYPQDKEAVFWAGDVRFHQGDIAAAIPYFERALALDPDYRLAMEHIVRALGGVGRADDALTWARRWADTAKDSESRRSLGRTLLSAGRVAEAEQAFRDAGAPDAPAIVSWLAYGGRIREAEARARRAVASRSPAAGRTEEDEQLARAEDEVLANVLVLQGRWRDARVIRERLGATGPREAAWQRVGFALGTRLPADARAAADAVRSTGMDDPALLTQVALALALAGDTPAARELRATARASPQWASAPEPMRVFLDAVIASSDGKHDEAEASIRSLGEKVTIPEARYQTLVILGEWAARRGDAAAAVDMLEQAQKLAWPPDSGAWFWLRPRALYFLADAHAQLGHAARARETLDTLRTLWARADRDVPLLADVEALHAKLEAGAALGKRTSASAEAVR